MTFLEMIESNLHDFLTEASVSTDSNDSVASNSSNLTLNDQQKLKHKENFDHFINEKYFQSKSKNI